MDTLDSRELASIATRIRRRVIQLSSEKGTPHLGSSLSCIDALVAAYWGLLRIDPNNPSDPDRDRFVLSKGHAALALYCTLVERGYAPDEILETYNTDGAKLGEHPAPGCMPGVEAATGSLGHGLPVGVGMSLAAKIQGRDHRTIVLMSDGECNEGSVWEAAMLAPAKGLDNLAVIVDFNKWQATGRSRETLSLDPLVSKWEAFGWSVREVDGHDAGAIVEALADLPDGSGKPVAVVAHTVKGKGVSFMEDDNNWHYRVPTAEEVAQAFEELQVA